MNSNLSKSDNLLTRQEVAKSLRCDLQTIDRLRLDENLPFFKIGKRALRVRLADLEVWLEELKEKDFDPVPKQPK